MERASQQAISARDKDSHDKQDEFTYGWKRIGSRRKERGHVPWHAVFAAVRTWNPTRAEGIGGCPRQGYDSDWPFHDQDHLLGFMPMKGIILAGGAGSRLYPLTLVASKQLQAVYDKPMVYYPLTTLIENGIREFCLISTPRDLPRFEQLFGDGGAWGLSIEYRDQPKPEGIAQAFLIAESFVGEDSVALILGDNIFYGGDGFRRAFDDFKFGATIFSYHVHDPQRYGVVAFDARGRATSIEEKPKLPKSSFAVPGLYLYDNQVIGLTKGLRPSPRGELEITSINLEYLRRGQLKVYQLSRGFAWLDAGTSRSLHEASAYVQTIEKRQGIKIGCPEEAALRRGFLSPGQLEAIIAGMPDCEYRGYLMTVMGEHQRGIAATSQASAGLAGSAQMRPQRGHNPDGD